MSVAFITHPDCLQHDAGQGHPECPDRLRVINDQLIASGLEWLLCHYEAPEASREQLLRVHDAGYIQRIFDAAPKEGYVKLDPDTIMNPRSLSAALHAAGAVVLGVDLVMRGETDKVFCNVRPPGHHAERNRAMGFCIFNNVAVGAAHALAGYGLERVAIVDFDVHHGNGTENIFRDEPRLLYCSSFQHPFYPYMDFVTQRRNMIRVPLQAGTGSADFRAALDKQWWPALESFKPQLILCSAGFDAHAEDPLANLRLNEEDYAWVTQRIITAADKYAEGRVISTLEGGYALHALGRSVAAHIKALLG